MEITSRVICYYYFTFIRGELFDEWCQNHGEILYSRHSLELGHCQEDGETLSGNLSGFLLYILET